MKPNANYHSMIIKKSLSCIALIGLLFICQTTLALTDTPLKKDPNLYSLNEAINLLNNKQYAAALVVLNSLPEKLPQLKNYINYWRSTAEAEMGHYTEALNLLPQTSDLNLKLKSNRDILWHKFDLYIDTNQMEKLENELLVLSRQSAANSSVMARILYYRAKIAVHQHANSVAISSLKTLFSNYPGSDIETKALTLLEDDLGKKLSAILSTAEKKKRAEALLEKGYYSGALTLFDELASKGSIGITEQANAYFSSRNYAEAATLYEKIDQKSKNASEKNIDFLKRLAASNARSDQFDKAILHHKTLALALKNSPLAIEARYKVGFIYFDSGRYQEALKVFAEVLPQARGKIKSRILWYTFWSHYFLSLWSQAQSDLQAIASQPSDASDVIKARYWKARVMERSGQSGEAQSIYRGLSHNSNYYGWLSSLRLKKSTTPFFSALKTNWKSKSDSQSAQHFDQFKSALVKQPQVFRGWVLCNLGFYDYGLEEMGNVSGPNNFLDFTFQYNKILSASGGRAYPLAFSQLVSKATREFGVDPSLILSIMRQESGFRPFIESPALAVGLMQIIPETAQEIAKALGLYSTFDLQDLKNPAINVRMAGWYLADRLRQFNGNLAYTIASYNAGPKAVTRWRRWADKLDPDEFIELIPYEETNNYVKKVLMNKQVYRSLNGQ